MGVLRLPFGPWKPLLSGKYEGFDISLYQNPDRDLFSVLVDTDENGKPRGLVVIMYRAFLVDGPAKQLMEGLNLKTMLITKRKQGQTYQFLLLEEGPKYIGLEPKELEDTLDALGNAMYKDTAIIRKAAKAMSIALAQLRDVPRRVAAMMLAEPVLLPSTLGVAAGGREDMGFDRVFPIGRARDGNVVKESILEFSRTVIFGEHEAARKRILRILLENALLTGIPAVVLTPHQEDFGKMNEPAERGPEGMGVAPIGFPRKLWSVGNGIYVDLNVVGKNCLAEALGISSGGKALEVLEKWIDAKRGTIEGIRDIRMKLTRAKYHELQALRVVQHHQEKNGEKFGRNNATELMARGEIGEATVIKTEKSIWTVAALESMLEALLKFLEPRGKTRQPRIMFFVEDAQMLFPRVESPIIDELMNVAAKLVDYGVAFVVEAPNEAEIRKEIVDLAEATVITVNDSEVGVRLLTKRPYRITLREYVSNISEGFRAPSVSAQQAPQPGGR